MSEALKNPLLNLLTVSVISAIIIHLCSGTKFIKSIKMLCALFLLSAVINIISPLFEVISAISFESASKDEIIGNEAYGDTVIQESADYISKYTEELLCSRFDVSSEDISVAVTLEKSEDGTVSIKNVTVELVKDLDCSAAEIADIVSKTLLCECIVLSNEVKE